VNAAGDATSLTDARESIVSLATKRCVVFVEENRLYAEGCNELVQNLLGLSMKKEKCSILFIYLVSELLKTFDHESKTIRRPMLVSAYLGIVEDEACDHFF
jgi:hypothetical protein